MDLCGLPQETDYSNSMVMITYSIYRTRKSPIHFPTTTVVNYWKTPTKDYWYYIYVTRTCSSTGIPDVPNACWIKGTIAGQAGMILFPDNYAHPGDASVTYNKAAFNKGNYSYTYFVADAENWSKMEAAGAVFLPAAGYRNTGNLDRVGERGFYWSSTTRDKDDAWRSSYNADNNDPNASNWRYHGYSVRLIREL